MARRYDMTRDPKAAPTYTHHWHAWVRYPSGLRYEGGSFETRPEAVAKMKAMRELQRDGFPRYVAWCTDPSCPRPYRG